jgi:hypothetical protein
MLHESASCNHSGHNVSKKFGKASPPTWGVRQVGGSYAFTSLLQ